MIFLNLETPDVLHVFNDAPQRRDGYVEVERENGDCRRIILAPGDSKTLKLNPGIIVVRWSEGIRVTGCYF